MYAIDITIHTDDQRFFDALEHPEGLIPILADKVEEIAYSLVGELQEYPSETEANAPGRFSLRDHRPMGFYERGRGWWYPIKGKFNRDGARLVLPGQSVSGMRKKTVAMFTRGQGTAMLGATGYRLRSTSEHLKENWVVVVAKGQGEVAVNIGNLANYSGYVQGAAQAAVMAKYGWTTIEDMLSSPYFQEITRKREQEALDLFYGSK